MARRWPTRVAVAALVAVPLLAGACAGDDGTAPVVQPTTAPPRTSPTIPAPPSGPDGTTSPTLASAPNPVRIVGRRFEPATIEVSVGDEVSWINADDTGHWIVSRRRDVIDSATLEPGNSYTERFPDAGTFAYFCNIHDEMTGTVVVR